jgi:hypothetical protein
MSLIIQKVQAEASELKSRLFDSLEAEKKLRAQLQRGGAGGGGASAAATGGSSSAETAQLKAELQATKTQLEAKVSQSCACEALLHCSHTHVVCSHPPHHRSKRTKSWSRFAMSC